MAENRKRAGAAESELVRRGRADGTRAARAGQYDEWSFEQEQSIPYAQLLDAQEQCDVTEEAINHETRLMALRTAQAAQTRQRRIAREAAEAEIGQARGRLARNQDHRETSRAQLDLLTGVHDPIPEDGVDPGPTVPGRWIGPADGQLSPVVPPLLKYVLMVLLAVVEVPIYFSTFRAFDPRNFALVWCFTIPVALCMVLAPHLSGLWLRKRLAKPSIGIVPTVASGVLMTAWFGAAVLLAKLRSTTLVQPLFLNGHRIESPVSNLGPTTLLATFGLVIVVSGLLSFLLGIADNHPAVSAFARADRGLRQAEEANLKAVRTHASVLIEDAEEPEVSPEESLTLEHEKRLEVLQADYAAAWAAYRDAWSLAAGNPSRTQAAGSAAPHTGVRV
ncbi:Uncharacterised protein [Amycolatopsis camponoti]|uniref:Uncharacterized protein n=1 Tax=Amycolatopsis camponoti TaxID=2606593 RepID=A0A6I8LCR6_9PSEU|nr:hypothetical protein [Amycolatopsis camponoti]VVJ15008.1 Uncharacterised protein [Amycolatopsis camponoti]